MKTYVVLDRSGSMSQIWSDMIGGIDNLAKEMKGKSKLFIAAFDDMGGFNFDQVYNGKRKHYTADVFKDFSPRGMTPLYDAIFMLNEQIKKDEPKKAQILIVTDGFENSSVRIDAEYVKELVATWKTAGYDVIYIGATFEGAYRQSQKMGIGAGQTVNMTRSDTIAGTMSTIGMRGTSYAEGATQSMDDLSEETRKEAGEK